MTDPLTSLVERLEKAEGGDRDLDAAIAVAIFQRVSTDDDLIYARPTRSEDDCAPGTYWRKSRSGLSLLTAPYFTSSIDVALTLVPEGKEWRVEQRYGKGMRPAYCSIWSLGARDNDFHANGDARTVALAIVIAALRAHHQGEADD